VVVVLVSVIIAGGLAAGNVLLPDPEPEILTYYVCLLNNEVIWYDETQPDRCPRHTEMIRADFVKVDEDHSAGHRLTVFLRSWLSIPGVMTILVVASLLWLFAGWRLGGWRYVQWLLVPLLAFAAAACVAGPGHWFAKEPWEGPSVISLGTGDAITVLDLVGLTLGALAVVLAIRLATLRWRYRLG
jgi:hypothetical protein